MNSYVPINIRPHLVSFFFQEVEGKEIHYLKFRSKSFIMQKSSALNAIIRILLVATDIPVQPSELSLLLTINESQDKKTFEGTIFQPISGKNHFLKVPAEVNNIINDLLEDIFLISFVYYVLGHTENTEDASITNAIYAYIEKYELHEHGYNLEMLRRHYYRVNSKKRTLSRLGSYSTREK